MLYIIVPYRNRVENLNVFLNEAVPIIHEVLPKCNIVFIEQANIKPFNRGLLLNVGVIRRWYRRFSPISTITRHRRRQRS